MPKVASESIRIRFPRSIARVVDDDLERYRSQFRYPNDRTALIDEVLRLRRELRRIARATHAELRDIRTPLVEIEVATERPV